MSHTAIGRATSRSYPPSPPPSAPRIFSSRRPRGDYPGPRIVSPPAEIFSNQPNSDTFPCRSLARPSLSGSVQWQCIRNGSGDAQVVFHVFRPNHCGYTAKHYADPRTMPTGTRLARLLAGLCRFRMDIGRGIVPHGSQAFEECQQSVSWLKEPGSLTALGGLGQDFLL